MKHCLIIDDTDQTAEIASLEMISKAGGHDIKCSFFNIDLHELKIEETINNEKELTIDLELVLKKLNIEFNEQRIDLVACDFNFNDKLLNGLKLIMHLKRNKWKGKNIPYLLYSAEDEIITSELQFEVKELLEDKDNLKLFLQSYYENYPTEIINRTKYDTKIYEFLKKNKTSLEMKLEYKLREYPNEVFKNIFPRFKDKKLSELAEIIRKNNDESEVFENEFFERSIAHFVDLKE